MADNVPRTCQRSCMTSMRRDRRGSATLEFAMVAIPLIFWIFALLIFGLYMFTQAAIDAAIQEAGRQIQIANIRGTSAAPVRTLVCNRMGGLVSSCPDLQIYATSGTSFLALTAATLIGSSLSSTNFDVGGAKSYVLLQIAYKSPFLIPFGVVSSVTLTSSFAFKNEP